MEMEDIGWYIVDRHNESVGSMYIKLLVQHECMYLLCLSVEQCSMYAECSTTYCASKSTSDACEVGGCDVDGLM